ncbi:hypothetical protein FVE85_3833 [Porphyridium purpureum]|uniref:Uncharacterized protein n=1 Tax=Porphyridium purpureum TaxID=35688 RepID=A0A5J4YHA3_PORPP|nr:hypothetical protein FVE85_9401 [Porphyridium purpureum]KAA8490684.1 hypothetical protein FVE85_3833 [Porphyridium purpureum]|eukprot:POR1194..scf255_21
MKKERALRCVPLLRKGFGATGDGSEQTVAEFGCEAVEPHPRIATPTRDDGKPPLPGQLAKALWSTTLMLPCYAAVRAVVCRISVKQRTWLFWSTPNKGGSKEASDPDML